MTESDLRQIEERAERASPGPWKHLDAGIVADSTHTLIIAGSDQAWQIDEINGIFIAHSRQDVPVLCAEIRRLKEALTSIASFDRPRQDQVLYWLELTHEQCAQVLGTDTKIAREALK